MNFDFYYGFYDLRGTFYKVEVGLNASFDYYKELKNVLKIKKCEDFPLVRIGLPGKDGGYIMLNDFQDEGIAYSFGICNDVSWDNVMAELGYNIYMYDHTINKLPYERKEFHFFKEGISGTDEPDNHVNTMNHYLTENNHTTNKNMILKMDVEGAEWDFLKTVKSRTLQQFDQIVFEFHDLVLSKRSEEILELLEKINKTHQLVHLHGNNSSYIIKIEDTFFPNVLEATYVSKEKYKTVAVKDLLLPIELDCPNDCGRRDVILGKWNEPLQVSK